MVQRAIEQDAAVLAGLALLLWNDHDAAELRNAFSEMLKSEGAACFLAYEAGVPAGFAQCQLRHDYVEGTDSSPVGYLEGIYVLPGHRRQGIAKALLSACESWAKSMGCREFASDCELTNKDSLKFHLNVGFREANRIICFVRELN